MGVYNNLYVSCPRCGESLEIQSKAGPDSCSTYYDHQDIPTEVIDDIDEDGVYCNTCEQPWRIIARAKMRPVNEILVVEN